MQLIEVDSIYARKLFHKLLGVVYKSDPNFACPLEKMVEESFDASANSFFKYGKAKRWVLIDKQGKPIGRIAAFYNSKKAFLFDQPTGNIGFFECIDNTEAASALFDAAVKWLKSEGMEAMDGPTNLGENYMNHGLLTHGFVPQGFGMPYNPPYYKNLFEDYGFRVYYEQYSYHLDLNKDFPERFWKIAEWVNKKPQFSFKHFEWAQIDKFVDDFANVYDAAWSRHEHYMPLDKKELYAFIQSSKILLDEEFVWFAYCNKAPIAVFVMLPDFNQVLRILKNGKLSLMNILKLTFFVKMKRYTRARIIIMGIAEKHQKSGIESAIFYELKNKTMPHKKRYKELELSWAGDFNPKIISLYKSTGAEHKKTHCQMRYLFDRDKTFERAKVIL